MDEVDKNKMDMVDGVEKVDMVDKVNEVDYSLKICYIFGKQRVQGYQISHSEQSTAQLLVGNHYERNLLQIS